MLSFLKRDRALVLAASVIALVALAGCASNKETAAAKDDHNAAMAGPKATADAKPAGRIVVVNTICPIGADDFESKDRPAELARTYKGQSIGFCCDHCTAKFDKMTDEKKAEVARLAAANSHM